MTPDQHAFLQLMRPLLPPRDTRRPTLADWLSFRDGILRLEPCRP